MRKTALSLLVLSFIVAGCTKPVVERRNPVSERSVQSQGDKRFSNLEDLKQFMAAKQSSASDQRVNFTMADSNMPMMAKSVANPVASMEAGGGALKYSQTNNQVAAVDEADIIKTNGDYIFYARGQEVVIVKSNPTKESSLVATIKVGSQIENLFLFKNKLMVYGRIFDFIPPTNASTSEDFKTSSSGNTAATISAKISAMPGRFTGAEYSYVKIYDISDATLPKIISDLKLEGSPYQARLIDSFVYLLTNKYDYGYGQISPLARVFSGDKEILTDFPVVHYFDMPYQSYSFTAVNILDLAKDVIEPSREIYLLGGTENLYMSEKNLYITSSEYLNEQDLLVEKTKQIVFPKLSEKDQSLIASIEAIDENILSKVEKIYKTNSILMRYAASLTVDEQAEIEKQVKAAIIADRPNLANELQQTIVRKIKINGLTQSYVGDVKVPGQVLNQFSMDEKDDNLRIATTKEQTWSQILGETEAKSLSNVYVLGPDMKIVGRLEKLAPGERIYAVRFMGDKAYLVTFVQTDPLFVIDLANPVEPKVLGELKIPGFSNYLHPISENIILGLGKDTETNKWGGIVHTSLKLALFDVTNPVEPKELSSLLVGGKGSDTSALYDHKAFLYDAENKFVALPVTLFDEVVKSPESNDFNYYREPSFNGTVVISLSDNKLTIKGQIGHNEANPSKNGNFDYQKAVKRNIVIDKDLFSFSEDLIKINSIDDLVEVNRIKLPSLISNESPVPVPYNIDTEPMILR